MKRELLPFKPGRPRLIPSGKHLFDNIQHPSFKEQWGRLRPTLHALQDVMDRKHAALRNDIQGVDPEFVLVFEVAGSVSDFAKAVKKSGMEWMLGVDTQLEPGDGFFVKKKDGTLSETSKLSAHLFLTMTNRRALAEMLSLWKNYSEGKRDHIRGFSQFIDVFEHLKNIRKWDVRDRFEETGVKEAWKELLLSKPTSVNFEIELWYRDSEQKRAAAQNSVLDILAQYGGSLVRVSIYTEIGFHGLIVKCPAEEIQRMLDQEDHELINAEQIMSIRATGQTMTISAEEEVEACDVNDDLPLPVNPPVIALLDGLPLANHALLDGRLDINDPDNFASTYLANQRLHGTTMASLIIHGDLHRRYPPLDSKLYVRPIMKPLARSNGEEAVPEDRFFVDVLHDALREIGETPALQSIRVVNISIGNPNRPFIYALSPEAKMIDWMSEKYNLLVIVSSGNHPSDVDFQMTVGECKNLSAEEKLKLVYKDIWENQAFWRILSPSENINGVCVGASHADFSNPSTYSRLKDLIPEGYPAAYSCMGGGYRGAIKPDLMMNGGKQLYNLVDIDTMQAKFRVSGQSSKNSPGQLTAVGYDGLNGRGATRGTSNATALVSRMCADFLEVLRGNSILNLPPAYEPVALKAMLVHACSWGMVGKSLMDKYVPQVPRAKKKETLKWIGYGFPNPEISSFCTDQRVTLMGHGELTAGSQVEFKFPLPSCLISQAVSKRLTITLAWLSPVAPTLQNYRLAKLSFSADKDGVVNENKEGDERVSQKGTVQHGVFIGKQASTYVDGSDLTITVACNKEAHLNRPVKYVLMATLEVAPQTMLPIYQEVESRVRTQVGVGAAL